MIDYVIISSDDNPMYKDFYPIVAKRWSDLGFKVYYINITDSDEIIENEFGIYHKMKSLSSISTGFQSQVVRLFASKFIDGYMLTSDIDMLPINKDYFNQYNGEVTKDNVIVYSGQPYGDVPYFPMCYVLSHSKNFVNYLDLKDLSFEDYCQMLIRDYGQAWNTDENFMYDKFKNHIDSVVIKNERDFSKRIDRGNWSYDIRLLENYYIDSHLLRPYMTYKSHIDYLINLLDKKQI